ncbi:FHA domain-containing protein FhaA [Frondihabitans sp. 762G35]|uniref:FHA domain-containing protein n=1 Tax=Frondihabitans sp. 762G35 TaxID=1446794 RepID=UPI000D21E4D8|nr:FHA domain-containing protein [Frondihabitans sp. 762G35]ARC57184.1 FHA domain-containing protein FhaA [Frondihabitans sp. 762G35]
MDTDRRADDGEDTVAASAPVAGHPGVGHPGVGASRGHDPHPHAPLPRLRVRVGTSILTLDAPVVVGRRPSRPRVVRGQVPQLVTVASPLGEVSSSHVEIRQDGAVAVVTDLRSTNGTRVDVPGRQPAVLRQGESRVVLAGTIVDIGDGNRLEILPLSRITLQEEPHP